MINKVFIDGIMRSVEIREGHSGWKATIAKLFRNIGGRDKKESFGLITKDDKVGDVMRQYADQRVLVEGWLAVSRYKAGPCWRSAIVVHVNDVRPFNEDFVRQEPSDGDDDGHGLADTGTGGA